MKPFPSVTACLSVLVLLSLVTGPRAVAGESVVIRLGTILPSGTGQHALLQELGERWRILSGGTVKLVLYPDGLLGGEAEMVKKLRIKQLNAGLFSVVGLTEIDPGASGLQMMPLIFHSWAEVDYVREQIRPQLEQRLRAKGFEVVFWADAGWVKFFSKEPATRPGEFRRMKIFTWAGDAAQLALMQAVGYQPVPLETGDILLGLNTNMITSVPMTPLVALAGRINGPAPHMLDMKWVPIVGAAIVRADVWAMIPPDIQAKLRVAADETGKKIRARGRLESEEAVQAMEQHGLLVHVPTAQALGEWEALVAQIYPQIRGTLVPVDIFDAVERHLRDFREQEKSPP